MKKFYDTNAMLELQDKIFDNDFYCSTKSLEEIENIKVSAHKDGGIKFKARKLAKLLMENAAKFTVISIDEASRYEILVRFGLSETPDTIIITDAYTVPDCVFVTNDVCCKLIAEKIVGLPVISTYDEQENDSDYKGFKEIVMSHDEMADFYSNKENKYGLLTNEYLIIRNQSDEIVDTCRWTGVSFEPIYKKPVKSIYFDKLKAKDIYQSCAVDSLINCTITAITGKAGSGKSLLSLMAAMHLIDTGKYDCLVVMFNPTKTRGAADMGFYAGDFQDKAMQSSIGQVLTTKFGDRYAIDLLVQQNKMKLISMADARGMEIRDNEILWITECQNTSVDLIKLCLTRLSSGSKVFIEGDYLSQTDSYSFDGDNNGLKRVIEAFAGQEEFGYVQLQNVWRSKIAELCELL